PVNVCFEAAVVPHISSEMGAKVPSLRGRCLWRALRWLGLGRQLTMQSACVSTYGIDSASSSSRAARRFSPQSWASFAAFSHVGIWSSREGRGVEEFIVAIRL